MPRIILFCLLTIVSFSGIQAKQLEMVGYTGVVGPDIRFHMILEVKGSELKGVYYYDRILKDIQLKGSRQPDGRMVIEELDPAGRTTAVFDFPATGKIEGRGTGPDHARAGSWKHLRDQRELKVKIVPEFISPNVTIEKWYSGSAYGDADNDQIHRNIHKFWLAVKEGRADAVAGCIIFPSEMNLAGKRVEIKNARQFIRVFPQVFTPEFRKLVTSHPPRYLWYNYMGLMLGQGCIWFNFSGRVIAVNN